MAFSKARRLSDLVSSAGEVSSFVDASVTHADLHTSMDLTGKTVTVANASTGDSDTTAANTAFVQQEIAALVDSSPSALNTLNELAAALGDDANFSTTVTNSIATKLPLAGGTLTGDLVLKSDGGENVINVVHSGNTAQIVSIGQSGDNSGNGVIQLRRNNGTVHSQIHSHGSTYFNGGNVGIGFASGTPSAKLHVKSAGTGNVFYVESSDGHHLGGFYQESDTRAAFNVRDASGNVKVNLDAGGDSWFTGGEVGIGTASPSSPLHVSAAKNDGWLAQLINTGTGSDANGLDIHAGVDASDYILRLREQDGTDVMMVKYGGKVGIGTTAANNALTVSDATNISMSAGAAGQLRIEGNGYSGAIALDGDAMHIYQNSHARNLVLGNNETEQFRITAAGNISTNALSAVTTAGGGIWYDAANKYLSISHWASSARPTPAAMLHLSDNSNDLDVPQIRIEGRENPGDTKLDISVKDAGARLNLIEGPTSDANNGFGLFTLKTNAAANTTYPRRGGFKFDVNTTTPVEILNTGTLQLHGNSANWSETYPGHTKGTIHLDPDSNTDHFGNAITFGASDHNNGESTTAGIYLRTDGSYGSKMYLATSDSYATGAKMAMRINHAGHIHAIRGYITSQVPAFNAYYSGNSFAPGGNYIFAANATRFNNGNNFDTTHYRFTAPTDGLYRFYFRTITNGSASNQHLVFRKNGTDISGTNQHFSPNSGTAWCQLEMETVQDLSDGDTIDIRFVTLTISIHGNAWNEFSGHLIG